MPGEIDIRDSTLMRVQDMLNGRARILACEIPQQRLLIRSADNPCVTYCKGRPLHVRHIPRSLVR